MNTFWLPTPKKQPVPMTPAAEPNIGLEALVIASLPVVSTILLRLFIPGMLDELGPDSLETARVLVSVGMGVFWVSGIILSLADWKTKFGPLALLLSCIWMILG